MSRSLTSLILGCGLSACLVALAACDRQGGEPAQGATSATATATAAGAGAGAAEPTQGLDRSHRGSALPGLTFADPAGRKLALASQTGQPLLINLWATWCAPCVKELPTLDALAGAGRVRVITVSQDSTDGAKVAAFLADRHLTRLAPWLDPDSALSFHYGGGVLPMSVLYDSAGREVWRYSGEREWGSAETAALLAEAR